MYIFLAVLNVGVNHAIQFYFMIASNFVTFNASIIIKNARRLPILSTKIYEDDYKSKDKSYGYIRKECQSKLFSSSFINQRLFEIVFAIALLRHLSISLPHLIAIEQANWSHKLQRFRQWCWLSANLYQFNEFDNLTPLKYNYIDVWDFNLANKLYEF